MSNKQFVSSLELTEEEAKIILFNKIEEEKNSIKENISELDIEIEKELLLGLNYSKNKINVVSLFSGAGGLDLGVELAGLSAVLGEKKSYSCFTKYNNYKNKRLDSIFNFIYSNDVFDAANETYVRNFPKKVQKVNKDIKKISTFPECQLMIGGFPCPGFSASGPRLLDDERNFLYIHFIRALIDSQPEFFVAENVKGLMTMAKGVVLEQIIEDFSNAGYDVKVFLVNSRDYGVPQLRERVFIIGSHKEKITKKYSYEYFLPEPTHGKDKEPFVTIKDSIGDLENRPGPYFKGDFSPMYLSRNRKKKWDDQSFTIQASGRQAPLHPSGSPMLKKGKDEWELVGNVNRRLSVKEIARIQTFPDWFEFYDGGNLKASENHRLNQQYKQIGNAVPVKLAEKIIRPIAIFMKENLL